MSAEFKQERERSRANARNGAALYRKLARTHHERARVNFCTGNWDLAIEEETEASILESISRAYIRMSKNR